MKRGQKIFLKLQNTAIPVDDTPKPEERPQGTENMQDKDQEDLHKAVLVSNTVKAAEKEIKNAILQALFF